ncbi:MAG: RimK/LysX family protein, partial [Pirellulales bacterium]
MVGWREWVGLPQLGVPAIKAKIDTGARSSSLHAFSVETFRRRGALWVRFQIHPRQRSIAKSIRAEARVLEHRSVRSSSGHLTQRPVIVTPIELLGQTWLIELTLANRDELGFRMLLGREALRQRLLVDPGRSYLAGKP